MTFEGNTGPRTMGQALSRRSENRALVDAIKSNDTIAIRQVRGWVLGMRASTAVHMCHTTCCSVVDCWRESRELASEDVVSTQDIVDEGCEAWECDNDQYALVGCRASWKGLVPWLLEWE